MSPAGRLVILMIAVGALGTTANKTRVEQALDSASASLESVRTVNTFLTNGGGGSGGVTGGGGFDLESGGGDDGGRSCEYRCPSAERKPQPRRGYRPTFNGCGSSEFRIDTTHLPGITNCCNQHDICYGTCNQAKPACEEQFRSCLALACDAMRTNGELRSPTAYGTCRNLGDTFVETVENFGCDFYLDAQEEACDCGDDGNKPEQSAQGRAEQKQKPRRRSRRSQAEQRVDSDHHDDQKKSGRSFLEFGLPNENEEL